MPDASRTIATLTSSSIAELLGQRIFGLTLGYEDLNDHDLLRLDPLLAVACGKNDPLECRRREDRDRGKALAGKSTVNRLELAVEDGASNRYKPIVADPTQVGALLLRLVVDALPGSLGMIVLDFDATGTVGITVQGTDSVSGLTYNLGVKLSQSDLTNASGNIDGTSNGSALFNTGIALYTSSTLSAGTTGQASIDGAGMGSATGNRGIQIAGRSTLESTGSGSLSLTGTGGRGNHGVYMTADTTTSILDGLITGTAGAGTPSDDRAGSFFP